MKVEILLLWTSVLMRYIDAECMSKAQNGGSNKLPITCDYIIVGAGAAGSVVTSRLSEVPNVVVCLFEAGKMVSDLPISSATESPRLWQSLPSAGSEDGVFWDYTTIPQKGLKGRSVSVAMGKGLGGSTTFGAMSIYRGFKADYDYWAANGLTNWTYENVLPFFAKSENNVSPFLENSDINSRCGPLTVSQNVNQVKTPVFKLLSKFAKENKICTVNCNSEAPFGLCQTQWTIKSGKRETAFTAFLGAAAGRHNLFIFTEAFVTKILISKKHKRAYGIKLLRNGQYSTAYARREVIVSCGALNSPKLLQASGIGPKFLLRKLRIRPKAILPVGENYKDKIIMFFDLSLDIESVTFKSIQDPEVLAAYIFRREGLFAEMTGAQTLFLDTKSQRFNWPELQFIFTDGKNNDVISGNDIKAGKFLSRENKETRNGTSIAMFVSHPISRGRIYIRSRNPNDPPVIDPRLLSNRNELREIIRGIRKFQKLLRVPSMKKVGAFLEPSGGIPSGCKYLRFDSDKQWECIIRSNARASRHGVSTCRMGNLHDPSAVVDQKLRLKHIKGLRVADASVIPEVSSGNPQGPVIMIGERAADIIRKQYSSYN